MTFANNELGNSSITTLLVVFDHSWLTFTTSML